MKPTEHFNHEMVILARTFRGMTQAQLSDLLDTAQSRVSRVEHGLTEPDHELVDGLSKTLGFPKSFFYQHGSIYGLPLRHHRRRKQIAKSTLDRIHAEISIRIMNTVNLLRAVELESLYEVPEFDLDELRVTASQAAKIVRDRWMIPKGPIPNLTKVLEDAGVLIFLCEFGISEMDAVGMRIPNLPPLMFVNRAMPVDRMRFTLAHELGHLVLHSVPRDDMELEADQFASEFLMPAEDIYTSLLNVSLQSLALLKAIWRVSMGALLKRAQDLQAITVNAATRLYKMFSKYGWRRREPPELDLSPEPPTLVQQVLTFHVSGLEYTVDSLSQALSLNVVDFRNLYPSEGPALRLVG
jgi:Zn-dependent peptidase ImmA (M78 family)/transcriptional regulator with XRE-family HTH domain